MLSEEQEHYRLITQLDKDVIYVLWPSADLTGSYRISTQ